MEDNEKLVQAPAKEADLSEILVPFLILSTFPSARFAPP